MIFNVDPNKPAEEVIFTNRNSTSNDTVSLSGVNVKPVDFHKHSGFVLDSEMNYIKHIVISFITSQHYDDFYSQHYDDFYSQHYDDFYSQYYS